ncbi:MAG: N-acetylglucosamine kinase [Psychrobium sp.]
MNRINIKKDQLFIGIDGGGSKCKAVIVDAQNTVLGVGISGPANPLHGFEQTLHSITESAQLALSDAGLPVEHTKRLIAGVGLAGVNLPSLMNKMLDWQHPFAQFHLTTDLNIACLGAHNGQDGAIMITGTGSCGYSYMAGKECFIGGHGFPHGDHGSGAWTGLNVVNVVMRSLDQLVPKSLMNQKLLSHLSCSTPLDLVEVVAHRPSSFFASLAFVAFDAANEGDEQALAIINEGASYISSIADKLWENNPERLSLIGGLTPVITPYLAPHVVERLSEPALPPEQGAIIFAKQQMGIL